MDGPSWRSKPSLGRIKKFAKQSSLNITMLKQSDKIGELMANHDFSIGAAGGMTWGEGLHRITFFNNSNCLQSKIWH